MFFPLERDVTLERTLDYLHQKILCVKLDETGRKILTIVNNSFYYCMNLTFEKGAGLPFAKIH